MILCASLRKGKGCIVEEEMKGSVDNDRIH